MIAKFFENILKKEKFQFSGQLQHSLEQLGILALSLCSNKSLKIENQEEVNLMLSKVYQKLSPEIRLLLRKLGIGDFQKALKLNKKNFNFLVLSLFGKKRAIAMNLFKRKNQIQVN